MKVAALVLAAGGSARLGQPKQLLRFQGQTLVRRAVEAARAAGCFPIVAVVGRDHEAIAAELRDSPAEIVPNDSWKRGLGSSIRAGVKALRASPAIIILACDQPFVDAHLLEQLIRAREETGKSIVASAYAGTLGVPVLFAQEHFAELLSLRDAEGAKSIFSIRPEAVASVSFPAGAADIDQAADYARLMREAAVKDFDGACEGI